MSTGARLLEMLTGGGLMSIAHPAVPRDQAMVIVWSSGAEEQLEAFVARELALRKGLNLLEKGAAKEDLAACPFCGCRAAWRIRVEESTYAVVCAVCHARGPEVPLLGLQDHAWNRRREPNPIALDQEGKS